MTVAAMAYRENSAKGEYQFNWFKDLRLHPRENFFWWRILKNAIPTACWLFHRKLSETTMCPWGCNEEETLDHCTTQCSKVKQVLEILRRWGFGMPFVNSLQELLIELFNCRKRNSGMGRIFCYTVYQVWRARNDMKHHRMCRSPSVVAAAVLSLLPKPFKWPILEQWTLLPSNQAGLGIIARDHHGKFLIAAGRCIEHWDVLQAEILAACLICEVIWDWMRDVMGSLLKWIA
ncbi:uncharacterized protein LOC110100659 [Dendrobium catenatum]|uniref:uncharacterized protein LOC110100659 n=1 Tax=Dendrobium catenatum TaxID=906689 RepID=UPI0009F59415|nr:uncharacterized protein LOC110100659 [Dendrobium catenatum]